MGDEKKFPTNVVVGGIIHNNKILLIKRVKEPYLGFWSLPGGKVDFGEHPEEAMLREIKEETDLDCEFEKFKGIASEIVHKDQEKVVHSILYICQVKPLHTNIVEQDEGNLQWFDLDKLDDIKIIPSDNAMVKEFILKDNDFNMHKIKMIDKDGEYIMEEFGS